MNTAILSVKVDPKDKKQAQALAQELGFSLSALVKGFIKEFLRTKEVKFSLPEEERELTDWAKGELLKSEADIKAGRVTRFESVQQEMEYLDKLIADAEKRASH